VVVAEALIMFSAAFQQARGLHKTWNAIATWRIKPNGINPIGRIVEDERVQRLLKVLLEILHST